MIEIVEAERPEKHRYFPGQPDVHLAAYPLPHLIDAFVRFGHEIEPRYLERCRIMLRAGLVPDCIGKPGSPTVGVMLDYDAARDILSRL